MKKLDESKVRWIIRQKRAGMPTRQISRTMGVSTFWTKKLWTRYGHTSDTITYPAPMGRPANGLPGRRGHSAALSAYCKHRYAVRTEGLTGQNEGMHILHNTICGIMGDNGLASRGPKKERRRKWVRYERTYSNSMWHTGYKQLDDGRWFIAYRDDASRLIVGHGVFAEATAEHAIDVLKEAIMGHGKPASILTDHGTRFYVNAGEY